MKIKYKTFLNFIKSERPGVEFTHTQLAKWLCDKRNDPQTIEKISRNLRSRLNSDGFIKEEEIIKICEACAIDYRKLLGGEKDDNCVEIPVRGEVQASMGYGITVYDETQTATYTFSRKLAGDLGISFKNSEIIFGSGNSMEPTIMGGDSLLVDLSKKEINDGKIYCIRHEGQLKTKRLQKISKTKLKIISDNKDYEPIIIDFEKEKDINFEVIGEIRWCGRIFL